MPLKVAVVGAGVIGMSCAVRLLQAHSQLFEVSIFTKDEPLKTNSDQAVAIWYAPNHGKPLLQALCLDSLPIFEHLSHNPYSGVHWIPMVYYFKNESTFQKSQWSNPAWQGLFHVSSDLPPGFFPRAEHTYLISMHVPLIEVSFYRPFLLKQLLQSGGKILLQKVNALEDLKNDYEIVINCTGWET